MIRPLRKRHLQIWILWAILIPVGIIVAWMAVPNKVTQDFNRISNSAPTLPQQTIERDTIIASIDKKDYRVNILMPKTIVGEIRWEYKLKLEFINKKTLRTPSLLIYEVTAPGENIDKQELLGRIENKATQYFQFKIQDIISLHKEQFILYDIITKQTIDSINIKTPL